MSSVKPEGDDSLVRRLAGPSTGKAGLAQDQTEINRIIAEASKGSKFYENERRKDEELTSRIQRLLAKRDTVVNGADIANLESAADRMLMEMEARRDLSQIIVHVDVDAFYASVEAMDNPKLKGKAFGVGGGVLTTASYEARKFGVRSAMPGHIAKKLCPSLIIVPCRFPRYMEMSKAVMSVLTRYDPTMHPAGFDEAYLNITDFCAKHEVAPEECVQRLRQEVHEETGLTISAGIAPNTMLAKICSDRNKPDGQFVLLSERRAIVTFMKDLSVRKVPGIGRVNERILEAIGVKTCGDIYTHRAVITLLDHELGLHGLLHAYLGIGSNVVEPPSRETRKSVGVERTFRAVGQTEKLKEILDGIAESLEEDLEEGGWCGKTLTVKYKLDTYEVFTRARTLDRHIKRKAELFAIGWELLSKELPLRVRLLGLRLTSLKDLRVEDDKGKGIKRFFQGAPDGAPKKKSRIDNQDDDLKLGSMMEAEEEEFEEDLEEEPLESDALSPSRTTRKPSLSPNGKGRPRSGDRQVDSYLVSAGDGVQKLTCPICLSVLMTDNDGLNAHVDYCLSRGAIAELRELGSQESQTPKRPTSPKGGLGGPGRNPFALSRRKGKG